MVAAEVSCMTNCSDMKMGQTYVCGECGLELKVVTECSECGPSPPSSSCGCVENCVFECCGQPLRVKG